MSSPRVFDATPDLRLRIYSFAMCTTEPVLGEPPFALPDDEMVRQALKDEEIPDKSNI